MGAAEKQSARRRASQKESLRHPFRVPGAAPPDFPQHPDKHPAQQPGLYFTRLSDSNPHSRSADLGGFFSQRKKWRAGTAGVSGTWSAYLLQSGVILGTYVIAALSKVFNSRGMWVWNSKCLGIELVKSHRQVYYQHCDPALADTIGPAIWLQEHPLFSQISFGSDFFLELFTLIGLRNRGWGPLCRHFSHSDASTPS